MFHRANKLLYKYGLTMHINKERLTKSSILTTHKNYRYKNCRAKHVYITFHGRQLLLEVLNFTVPVASSILEPTNCHGSLFNAVIARFLGASVIVLLPCKLEIEEEI